MAAATLLTPDIDGARRFIRLMDEAGAAPKAVLWVYNPDSDNWRLWVVPSRIPGVETGPQGPNLLQFYGFVAPLVVQHRRDLGGLDPGDIHMVESGHPAVVALSRFVDTSGETPVRMSNNMLDGYFLPDAVILRLTPPKAA